MSFWKILRILVSDVCNYRCIFCHNEGQGDLTRSAMRSMRFSDMAAVVVSLQGEGILDAQFSGGEPFTNPQTIDMIEFIDRHTSWEIGCATNAQLITETIAKRLGQTRVQLNINVPSLREDSYRLVTGNGHLDILKAKLDLLTANRVDYAFNSVLRPQFLSDIFDMINFAAENGRRLKILPYLDVRQPVGIEGNDALFSYLDSIAEFRLVYPTARKWVLPDRGRGPSVVKYVDFPCYSQDIEACRHYAEIRLLPDMSIQPCLVNAERRYALGNPVTQSPQHVRDCFRTAWTDFIAC